MKRVHSLKRNKEFQYVYRVGKSCAAKSMVLIVARARHNTVKVGFSVSKKIGNSVVRNLVKRRMRECLRLLLPQLKPGFNLIFVARSGIENEPYAVVSKNMHFLLNKSQLFSSQ